MNDKENIKDIISEYTCDCQKINGSSDCYGCVHSDEYGHTCNLEGNIAQALSNAGYGEVEDYKKEIERLKEENQELRMELSHREQDLIHADEKVFYREQNCIFKENEIQKQAIKEFATKLSDKFYKLNQKPYDTLHNFEIDDLVNAEIDFLLREYGVEQ